MPRLASARRVRRLAVFFAIMTVAPLLVLLKVSISAPEDIMTARPPFLIHHLTLEHWQRLLSPENLLGPTRHSLVVATGTAILARAASRRRPRTSFRGCRAAGATA